MKPSELVWYPLEPSYPAGYVLPRNCRITYRAAIRAARSKRFTNAELAAEFWRAEARALTLRRLPNSEKYIQEADVLDRFATLPHYDGADQ